MIQLKQPNLAVQGRAGWCLWVAQEVWAVPHFYDWAIHAWNAGGTHNHPGEQPPSNVSVPVYWTYRDPSDGKGYGHIATWVPGRGVYSSPFNAQFGAEWYPSIQAMTDRIRRIDPACRYLGWSESLSGVKLVTKEEIEVIENVQRHYDIINREWQNSTGRELSREEFRISFVGRDKLEALLAIHKSEETERWQNLANKGLVATRDNWQGQIASLNQQLADAKVALQNAENKPPREVIKEVVQIVEKPIGGIDEATKNQIAETHGIVKAIQTLLSKVFK